METPRGDIVFGRVETGVEATGTKGLDQGWSRSERGTSGRGWGPRRREERGKGNRRPHLMGGLHYNPEIINFAWACPFYPLPRTPSRSLGSSSPTCGRHEEGPVPRKERELREGFGLGGGARWGPMGQGRGLTSEEGAEFTG